MGSDDSTGKSKAYEQSRRYTNLAAFFLIGLCVGVVVAERIYVARSKSSSSVSLGGEGRQLVTTAGGSEVQQVKTASSSLALDFSKPARNDLEEVLRKVHGCPDHRSVTVHAVLTF